MDSQNDPPIERSLLRAFAALALSGFYGTVAGVQVGSSIGMFFLFVGILPGMLIGAFVGFASAVFGAAAGGYRGWTYSGGLCAFLGGLFLYQVSSGGYPPVGNKLAWFLPLTVPATIGGLCTGYLAAKAMVDPRSRLGYWLEPLRTCLRWAALYEIPVEMRFLIAAVNLALAFLALKFFLPILSAAHAN